MGLEFSSDTMVDSSINAVFAPFTSMRKIFVCLVCWMIFHSCCALAEDDAGMSAYRQKDYASAMAEWKTAAEQGSARAKASIGVLYASGLGVAQDARPPI
jgi:hypothetical protein